MRRYLTTVVVVFSAAALAMLPAASVVAGPGSGGGGGTGGSEDGTITAVVRLQVGGTTSGGGCTWERVEGELGGGETSSATYPFTDEDGVTFNLWRKTCPESGSTWYVIPETEPEDLLPQLLEQLKSTRLPDPQPTFLALDPARGWAYVTVPLDFRAGGDSWRTVSATASIGPIWATVTAQPVRLLFDPGDPNGPGPVECAGDSPIAGYDPALPGACSYTYRNSSSTSPYDGYHFETRTSIDWSITWTSSSGAGGALEPYSTSATALLAVAEVKGLVTCTGSRTEQGGC
ncbi:MAG: hypothetical protein CL424_01090 [Acidimicrobiaceae bacterium]|nr:hypothetical protein [Acidimicrobiaceae bacterium]